MQTHPALRALRGRLAPALILLALVALAVPAGAGASSAPSVLTFKTMEVGSPGNPAVGIVPFTDAIYRSCAEVAKPENPRAPVCQEVGGVGYGYGIDKLEVTVGQWVKFLNTVDPTGRNVHRLYSETESGAAWPRFGQIDFSSGAPAGRHYKAAAPEWLDKPYGFANFLRSARFVNSLYNGKLVAKTSGTEGAFTFTTYKVRLSRQTERGMYDMRKRAMTRAHGHRLRRSQPGRVDQGRLLRTEGRRHLLLLEVSDQRRRVRRQHRNRADPGDPGSRHGRRHQRGEPAGRDLPRDGNAAAVLVPVEPIVGRLRHRQPLQIPRKGSTRRATRAASARSAGRKTLSPWGTLDQGGNVVEWTDTMTAPPFGVKGKRVWRRLHGGIANAPVYQLWLSAVGLQRQDNAAFTATYPWLGLRVAVVGDLKLGKG